jgi:glucosamine-6-phosphate deaminase
VPSISPSTAKSSLTIDIYPTRRHAAEAAAHAAALALRVCIGRQGHARIMVGTGNSQLEMIGFLARQRDIDWSKVDAFHLDEYVGLPADHPSSFRYWIRHQFVQHVRPRSISYIEGDAADLSAMTQAYSRQLLAAPVDLAFVGIGENGHIAFNDPHVADFKDPQVVKRVQLDEVCRRQQVGEGHFPDLDSVPNEAVTVTCSGLFRAKNWICCVPDLRKAEAIRGSLQGPVSTKCPGSLVTLHPSAAVFLDQESASLLSPDFLSSKCRVHATTPKSKSAGLVEA